MEINEIPAFGGIIKGQDKRDYNLHEVNQFILGGAIPKTSSNNDYSSVPIDMQGKQPACGAHAGARLKNILRLKAGKPIHSSPRFNWCNIKKIDNFLIEAGTDINSIFKTMRNVGICDFTLTGNDVTLDLQSYANLPITQDMTLSANSNKATGEAYIYYPTWQQIKDTIDAHGACIALIRVGQNMYKKTNGYISWAEQDILPLSPTNFPLDGGHFVVFENYDENYIYFGNSWGPTWGKQGIGYIAPNYLPYIVAIGTSVDVADIPLVAKPVGEEVKGQIVKTNWISVLINIFKKIFPFI